VLLELDMRTYWIVALSLVYGLIAQTTTLIDPTTDGGFEGSHGWTLVNSPTYPNRWCIGSAAPPSQGSNCLFISDTSSCSRYSYSGTRGPDTYVHAYKEINVPANQPYLTISFKAKQNGGGGLHKAIFYLMPSTTSLPQADVGISGQYRLFDIHSSSSGTIDRDGYIVSPTAYTSVSHVTCVEPGQAYRLVITWKSNFSVYQPPASIDEVSVVSSATLSDPSLGGGVIDVSTLPYTHPTTTTPTTCGSGKDLFEFNVKNKCGAIDIFDRGEDRVWTFVPTTSGCVRVQFTGDTSNGTGWQNMNLLIYEGNPLSCGQCLRRSVNRKVHTHIFPVQAGRKYYVVLESNWGEGTSGCDDFLGLTISAPDSALCALASLPLSAQGVREFTVYPNPASEVVRVQATGLEPGRPVSLRVRDMLGRSLIEEQTFPSHEGKIDHTLGVSQLPTGFYLIEVRQGSGYASQRLRIAP
jgi:hypothetical protein